ncbi:hypothetical protein PCANB_001255 [Pneumocystis canis]|nr:hypothetical protein PCANB_001255 [Pneumocystis canis]
MEKTDEKNCEYFRNNKYSYDQENIVVNRNERLPLQRYRLSLQQDYPVERHNHRFNSSYPDIISRGSRYPYVPLHECGGKKNEYHTLPRNYYFEKQSSLSSYKPRNHMDSQYFPEQVNNKVHELGKYERNIDEDESKTGFHTHLPHLTSYNTSMRKYRDQFLDSYIPIGAPKMNGVVKKSMYCKSMHKDRNWDRKKDIFEKNAKRNLSLFRYKKDYNYDLKSTSNSSNIDIKKNLVCQESIVEKKDAYEHYDDSYVILFNSENNLGKNSEEVLLEHKPVDASLQNHAELYPLSSPVLYNDAMQNCNKHNFSNDDLSSFLVEESKITPIQNEENVQKLSQEQLQPLDLENTNFENGLSFNSSVVNDDIISQYFSLQDNDENLTPEDIHNRMQKIDEEILTCEKRLYEIERKRLGTIDAISEDKKEVLPSNMESPNSLSNNDSSCLEADLCSKIYFENKEKVKQNCIKFSYFKIYNHSLNEYPFFDENETKHKRLRPLLLLHISRRNRRIFEKNRLLQLQYEKYRSSWESRIEKLDNIKKTRKLENERSGFLDTYVDNSSLRGFRRGQGLNYGDFVRSDADFEDIIAKLGVEDDRICRAATIPPMISDLKETTRYQYDDRNRIVDDPISFFHYPTWIDVWTTEEHELFKQLFIKYPQKNFGLIASGILNKTISQCVLHYYRTKKQENYKNLIMSRNSDRAKRKGRGRSSKKMEKAKASSLLADLQPNVVNDDMDDEEKE